MALMPKDLRGENGVKGFVKTFTNGKLGKRGRWGKFSRGGLIEAGGRGNGSGGLPNRQRRAGGAGRPE